VLFQGLGLDGERGVLMEPPPRRPAVVGLRSPLRSTTRSGRCRTGQRRRNPAHRSSSCRRPCGLCCSRLGGIALSDLERVAGWLRLQNPGWCAGDTSCTPSSVPDRDGARHGRRRTLPGEVGPLVSVSASRRWSLRCARTSIPSTSAFDYVPRNARHGGRLASARSRHAHAGATACASRAPRVDADYEPAAFGLATDESLADGARCATLGRPVSGETLQEAR
jgi:hypothetical protein